MDIKKIILICIPIIIFIQASIDWVLSENVVLAIMFLMLCIINYDINDRKNKFKILENIILVIFSFNLLIVLYSWIIEIYVGNYNKVNTDVFQQKYVSDYLLFRDDDRKEKWNNLQGLKNDNAELNREIYELIYKRLKYERNIDSTLNLLQYLQISQNLNLEIDMKLVDKIIYNMRPENKYSVQIICEYISNLYYIKEFIGNLGGKEEQLNLITQKMQYEYEQLKIKLDRYNELSMNYNYFETVNPENIELILESIDEYKKFCYN